jgi:SET domain-containing protein
VIDATKGNLTRFINHSIHPNLKPIHVFYEGFYHLIFLALRRIEKGTQLSYDYGKNYWYIREKPVELEIL